MEVLDDNKTACKKKVYKAIVMEISGACNGKCTYCVQARIKGRGYMDHRLFQETVDDLLKSGTLAENASLNLFNWGEPLLNPDLNKILRIAKDRGLRVNLSSNLIYLPQFDAEIMPVIDTFIFSISGFTQQSYGKIHGADLKKVLGNFEKLYTLIRRHSPKTKIIIAWHRYKFNEGEFWEAHRFFKRPGVQFKPVKAYINDGKEMLKFLRNQMPKEKMEQVKEDLFLDELRIKHGRSCPQWDFLVFDEKARLTRCCVFSPLDCSYSETFPRSPHDAFCKECISSGLSYLAHFPDDSFPRGGGVEGFRARFDYNLQRLHNEILRAVLGTTKFFRGPEDEFPREPKPKTISSSDGIILKGSS